ncbi:MAG: hypothetical protein V1792_04550 [Pseudomonadota bacterium]
MSRLQTLITAAAATMLLVFVAAAYAHKPLLAVEDNMDGTIHIEAAFSDGSSAAGHKILIKDAAGGKLLSEHRVGEDGTLELRKPSVKYTVTLDAGEGHIVSQDGPPPGGGPTEADAPKDEKSATAPPPATKQTESSGAERKPSLPPSAPAPAAKPPEATTGGAPSAPVMQAAMSPGVVMAFKMMMVTQVVTAVVLIFLVVIAAYYVGYRMGRNSIAVTRRKEV